jgi:small subunit ribosomal protein S8
MTLNDPLANVLSHIVTEDKKGSNSVTVKPNSKLIVGVLKLLKENKYLGDAKEVETGTGGVIEVNLIGAINDAGVIKPRHSVNVEEYLKFEERYLPAYGFGFLIVSTNKGLMTQEEAIKNKLGGKLIAYVY